MYIGNWKRLSVEHTGRKPNWTIILKQLKHALTICNRTGFIQIFQTKIQGFFKSKSVLSRFLFD